MIATGTNTVTKKSGKGISDGVVSELTAFFGVKPGHEQEVRAAVARFADVIRKTDPSETVKTGLRDTRHVLFDNDQRLLWTTTFETDWDPYLDDALIIVGVQHFIDWMQHTTQAKELGAWLERAGGMEKLSKLSSVEFAETMKETSGQLKAIIQSVQAPAAAYWNALADLTIPQISKAEQVEQAFQQVLDDPAAGEPLQHSAMKPLLAQASV